MDHPDMGHSNGCYERATDCPISTGRCGFHYAELGPGVNALQSAHPYTARLNGHLTEIESSLLVNLLDLISSHNASKRCMLSLSLIHI